MQLIKGVSALTSPWPWCRPSLCSRLSKGAFARSKPRCPASAWSSGKPSSMNRRSRSRHSRPSSSAYHAACCRRRATKEYAEQSRSQLIAESQLFLTPFVGIQCNVLESVRAFTAEAFMRMEAGFRDGIVAHLKPSERVRVIILCGTEGFNCKHFLSPLVASYTLCGLFPAHGGRAWWMYTGVGATRPGSEITLGAWACLIQLYYLHVEKVFPICS